MNIEVLKTTTSLGTQVHKNVVSKFTRTFVQKMMHFLES